MKDLDIKSLIIGILAASVVALILTRGGEEPVGANQIEQHTPMVETNAPTKAYPSPTQVLNGRGRYLPVEGGKVFDTVTGKTFWPAITSTNQLYRQKKR